MKKFFLVAMIFFGVVAQMNAQEKEKFRFDLRIGYASGVEYGDGLLLNFEPKWSIDEKINVGFRFAGSLLLESISDDDDVITFQSDIVSVYSSYLGTIDYYFAHKDGSPFAVFAGAGLGYVATANVIADFDTYNDAEELETDNGLGGMVRVGFDYFKFRVAAEYNFAPKGEVRDLNNNEFGSVKNGYFGLSLGFYFGGGKWKNVGASQD